MRLSRRRILAGLISSLLAWQLAPSMPFAVAAFTEQGATVLQGANFGSRSASLADYDNDGDLDLFFQGSGNNQKLLRNNIIGTGVFNFTDVTASMIPGGLNNSWSAAWGDYNGDGLIDVFVGQTNSGATGDVLRNNGAAGFSNESFSTGLNDPGFHQNVAWADIDNDHDLDLIIGMEGPEKHEIYLQGAGNQFTPVGAAVGFQEAYGTKGYGMAIGDSDGDGDLDIYISTCESGNNIRKNFYQNMLVETGTLGFVDIADTNGTQIFTNGYGAEFVDFDDDGDLDLYMAGADAQVSKIWRNDGGNMFTDVDTITGHPLLTDPAGDLDGARAVDYDNDGDLDLYFHNNAAGTQARKLYRNDGNWEFTDVTVAEGIAGGIEGAYDSTWGDLDLDGDQDLIVPNNMGSISFPIPERAFISDESTNGNHWLYVNLNGSTDNTSGLGASLYATINEGTPGERTLRREANTNAGTFNQSDLPVHFGLGTANLIDELQIRWPNGQMQTLFDVGVDQYLTITIPGPGDFDGDGDVDGRDFLAWQRNPSVGDLADWQTNYGVGALNAESVAVPEPGCGWLMLPWLAALVRTHRSRIRKNSDGVV